MSEPVLSASNLYRFYHVGDDEVFALRGVTLTIAAGEMVAVTGPSGSGKSTLLACLCGLDDPDGGTIEVAGQRLTRRSEAERARLRARLLGIMLQSGNLFSHLSVADNMRLQASLAGRAVDIDAILRDVGIENRRDALPPTLSGGEAARAGLAVAIAASPALLLCDEPTGEVDQITERAIVDLLRRQCQAGKAVLVVTHSAVLAASADRVLRLNEGSLQ